ncbi:MAG TPA: OmpA family protein [Kofleriaceae bacterium]|nr:OmpA family protein [Kofleriaceae bacterium]
MHAPAALHLDRVVLYQNGIGHFERSGRLEGDRLRLFLRPHEVDDVIKTLTVVDAGGAAQQVAAVLPTPAESEGDRVEVDVVLSRPGRDLHVSYAVPTAAWKTTYRLAMPEHAGDPVLLQSWAMVDNVSEESWDRVSLTLATGAPLSFATDLRTPHFVPRPDATGALVEPTVNGPIVGTATRGGDRDGDGIGDDADGCPDAAEDHDGFDDADGCPDPDNDHDAIPDVDDRCPDDGETENGLDDDDGCPDRGRVLVTDSKLEILDQIYFAADQAAVRPESRPIVDAVAATLRGNPDIRRVQLQGHAAAGERDAWGLSARRAEAVRAALAAAGVTTTIDVQPYGATQPIDPRTPAKNQRVAFLILERGDDDRGGAGGAPGVTLPGGGVRLDAATLARSASTSSEAVEVAGATSYQLGDRVTVPRGASTLVSVVNRPVPGEQVLLFRPDPSAPASDRHPFQAARVELPAELGLEPGPVAVYADGRFAGEGLLHRTHGGEVSYVPFALDGGTTVEVATVGDEAPQRLVTVARGVATVENAAIRRTTYTIAAGASARGRIFLRHVLADGFTLGDLPPGSEHADGAVLVPVPLTAGRTSTLVVEERQPVQRRIELLDDGATDLSAYLDGANLPAPVRAQADAVVAARAQLGGVEQELAGLRDQLADAGQRVADLEDSLRATAKLPGTEAADLRKRLLASLTAATGDADRLALAIAGRSARAAEARVLLQTAITGLGLEMTSGPLASADAAAPPSP